MKRLLLLRHAKSAWDRPELDDIDRPLAPRGVRACEVVAKNVAQREFSPDLVLCSPALRTRETLARVASVVGVPWETRFEEGLYLAPVASLLAQVQALDPEADEVLLVGHNPGLAELARVLVRDGSKRAMSRLAKGFKTGSLAEIVFDVSRWNEVEPGSGRLEGLVRPKDLIRQELLHAPAKRTA